MSQHNLEQKHHSAGAGAALHHCSTQQQQSVPITEECRAGFFLPERIFLPGIQLLCHLCARKWKL